MRLFRRESIRFIIAGGVNTLVTYVAYLLLLFFLNYAIAYTLTYIGGIFFGYYLSARFVFCRPLQWRHAIQYPLVYFLQYALGITLTTALVEGFGFDPEYVPLVVVVLTLPLTFGLARWIIKKEEPLPESGD